ncbi:unnamed protein product [Protopolystoma xenopodis]|uniref:Innexin n=1 Tax=Protopolystoma xenopodis TaxID=117903 RepID=A0A3S5FFX7_9PLAT|nr:unnamed protein product [Protopolystoma xenopodis]
MVWDIAESFAKFSHAFVDPDLASASLEDFADRLSYLFSFTVLSCLGLITTAGVYYGSPIICTLPSGPSHEGGLLEFAKAECWLSGTIALDQNQTIPSTHTEWEDARHRGNICKCYSCLLVCDMSSFGV